MSYTLSKTGAQIDAILARAESGGAIDADIALKAPLASPALTGSPTAPTQTAGDNSTKLATTAYVDDAVSTETTRAQAAEALKAPLASPALTGTPTAPTASPGTNNTQIATTAYTDAAVLVESTRAQAVEAAIEADAFGAYPQDSASGNLASFTDGANGIPMVSVIADINAVQSGSGDPSPNNVRPISGHTEANVTRAGKNRWNGMFVNSGLTSETDTASGSNYAGNIAMPISEGEQYTFSVSGTAVRIRYKFLDADKADLTSLTNGLYTTAAPTGAKYLCWRNNDGDGDPTADVSATGMMEAGTSPTTYEAYSGQTYTADWSADAGTVYGGTVDLVSGVLTVTHAIKTIADLSWTYDSGNTRFSATISGMKVAASARTLSIMSDSFVTIDDGRALADVPDMAIYTGSNTTCYITDSDYTDAASFTSAMGAAEIVYPLATPTTYQLTAQQIDSLKVNNLFADTGDVSVTYRADTTLYIKKKVDAIMAVISAL